MVRAIEHFRAHSVKANLRKGNSFHSLLFPLHTNADKLLDQRGAIDGAKEVDAKLVLGDKKYTYDHEFAVWRILIVSVLSDRSNFHVK